jgi:hypothetical protein
MAAIAPSVAPQIDLATAPETKSAASTEAVPTPEPRPTQVAALPLERRPATEPVSEDEAGPVADSSSATIPVDIGEASSTELPIVLPRERPAIPRVRRRAQERRHVEPHRRAKARTKHKPKLPRNEQPASQVNLFEQLFENHPTVAAAKSSGGKPPGAQTATTQRSNATGNFAPPPYNQFDVR